MDIQIAAEDGTVKSIHTVRDKDVLRQIEALLADSARDGNASQIWGTDPAFDATRAYHVARMTRDY